MIGQTRKECYKSISFREGEIDYPGKLDLGQAETTPTWQGELPVIPLDFNLQSESANITKSFEARDTDPLSSNVEIIAASVGHELLCS